MTWKLKHKYEGKVIHSFDLLSDKLIKQIEKDTTNSKTGFSFFNKYFEKV